jgi:hypothetical protein
MAARLAAFAAQEDRKAEVMIRRNGSDLGLCAEPPDGIEPSTYALRMRQITLTSAVTLRVTCGASHLCSPIRRPSEYPFVYP